MMNATLDLSTDVRVVTPAMAEAWLADAGPNRALRRGKVLEYSAAMLAGEWILTHQGLAFDAEGHLLDGFHRLHACLKAGVAFETSVTMGLEASARPVMDIGATRTPGDILHVDQTESNANLLAATLRWIWLYEQGDVAKLIARTFPKTHLFAVRDAHAGVRESFWVAQHVHHLCRQSLAVALHYLMAQKDPILATRFAEALFKGEGLQAQDTVYRLRQALIKNALSHRKKMTPVYQAAIIVQAWNLWRLGRFTSTRALRWNEGGTESDPFPTIR
jgi:hypothetical protein